MKTKTLKKNNEGKIKSFFIRLGSSMMPPIVILCFAVFMMGIASTFENIPSVAGLYNIINNVGNFVLQNFPFIVCLSIANTFAKEEKGLNVIMACLMYFSFYLVQASFINQNTDNSYDVFFWKNLNSSLFVVQHGVVSLNTGIFGGIGIAFLSIYIFDKTHKYIFKYIPFFSGTRFSLILSIVFGPLLAILSLVIWPSIGIAIEMFGTALMTLPFGMDVFFYGFFNRLLIPFGLHSVLIPIFNFSSVTGVLIETSSGNVIANGDYYIWHEAYSLGIDFNLIRGGGDFISNGVEYSVSKNVNPGQFTQGFYPIMLFAFPAAGVGLSLKSKEKKKWVKYFFVSLIPLLTGVTEPFEFIFVFVSFKLYILHALFTGFSFMSMSALSVSMGMSTGWFVDVFLFGVIPQLKSFNPNVQIMPYIGLVCAFVYFSVFSIFSKEVIKNKK